MSEENLGKIMGPNILHKVGGAGEGMGKEGKGREERTKGGEGRGGGGEGNARMKHLGIKVEQSWWRHTHTALSRPGGQTHSSKPAWWANTQL